MLSFIETFHYFSLKHQILFIMSFSCLSVTHFLRSLLYQRRIRMGSIKVERIDHLGIVAGVIQDLNIIDMIDSRITPDKRVVI